jgi:hypothetical protein
VYRLAYFTGAASYLRRTSMSMLKFTPTICEEVPLGTDDVFLIADDLVDLPVPEERIPHMDRLRTSVGTACTKVMPDLRLAKLTSRWDSTETLGPDQSWQMYFTRMIFSFTADLSTLRPLAVAQGEGGSGKSTMFECFLTMLRGRIAEMFDRSHIP